MRDACIGYTRELPLFRCVRDGESLGEERNGIQITVYGAPWCPDCRRAKQFLGEQRLPYDWIDVDVDPEGMRLMEKVNNGKQIIRTIVFGDGSVLVEPTNAQLAAKLEISPKAKREFYDLIIVGGGPARLTASIYAAREGIETLIIERSGVGVDERAHRLLAGLRRG